MTSSMTGVYLEYDMMFCDRGVCSSLLETGIRGGHISESRAGGESFNFSGASAIDPFSRGDKRAPFERALCSS